MLQDVIQSLVHAGIAIDLDPAVAFPSIGIQVDAEGKVFEVGGEATVFAGKRVATVSLPDISTLWTGDRTPPPFPRGPTPEYFAFFMLIERTASDFCSTGRRIVTDKEFERLYDLLRRRPDGDDPEPLFSYLQAAVRLVMSLRDVSRAEFEGVLRRLAQSARTFSDGYTSRNYYERALRPLMDSSE